MIIFRPKREKANAMLFKVRDYINTGILESVCHVLFESCIHYTCIIWG